MGVWSRHGDLVENLTLKCQDSDRIWSYRRSSQKCEQLSAVWAAVSSVGSYQQCEQLSAVSEAISRSSIQLCEQLSVA